MKNSFFILLILLIAAACSFNEEKKQADKPNIIFIFSDDHAFQAISAYQSRLAELAPTPNIDRIAKNGMRFDRAYVTNSICAPSRASVLTGLHSHSNGHRTNNDTFDGSQTTFPKLLQANGYSTALIGKWHLKSEPTGFDHWEILPGQGHYYNPDFIVPGDTIRETGYVTEIITDKTISWLNEQKESGKPFMLMMQHKAPHREWEKGPKQLSLYEDVTFPEPDNLFDEYTSRTSAAKDQDMTIEKTMQLKSDLKLWDHATDSTENRSWKRTYGRMNASQRAAWDAVYDPIKREFDSLNLSGKDLVKWKYQRYMRDYLAVIRAVDESVGEILDYLEANGLSENTLIVYTSDQGFYLGEHGWFDKRFMYEESFRTPLLMSWPGVIPAGSNSQALVSNLDFAQTFLDITQTPDPGTMQGLSLLPVMKGESPENWRKSLYYAYYEYPGVHSVKKHDGAFDGRYKLIHFYETDEWEFYDLLSDPNEMNNIYSSPEIQNQVERMKNELKRLQEEYAVENAQ
ncbi:sulfatase [Algoriphagus sp. CAU 1675]|uniref:sulfatase family protein n=1 Tax=Algoriphagus sp. CAU 1675 TaxID=3032597 RepID=UPI0023DB2D23|nr:sulfatase [Algoriphagus sp. CAU 1675]MDF2158423.1 sulfatase [Algoriphagus sp. CAU 1675]